MEITKGENANLVGMEFTEDYLAVLEREQVDGSLMFQLVRQLRERTAERNSFDSQRQYLLKKLAGSPAPTPPLDVEAEKRITEIRERESKATKGPWEALPIENSPSRCDGIIIGIEHTHPKEQSCWDVDECPGQGKDYVVETDSGVYGPCWEDADFISHSRQDIPFLLEQISLLRRHIASPAPQGFRLPDELMDGAVKVIHPTDLRNRIGRYMVEERGLHIGSKVDAGKVQDMIEEFVRRELAASPAQPEKRNECKCVGYLAGDRYATDTSPCSLHREVAPQSGKEGQ